MATDESSPLLREPENEENEVELSGCGATCCCDPRKKYHRYYVLIIMCFLSFGSYFCYDNPAALQDTMKADLEISTEQFMNFYAWYSWPNVILCFFGGFLIDRFLGIRLGGIVFSIFVTIGQFVFAMGAFVNNVYLMYVGRFIFGVGGESLCVAQNTYAVNWFQGRELNMVFGLQLSFSRAGSTVNMNVMQPLYEFVSTHLTGTTALGTTLFIAGGFCVFSLICAFLMAYFDKRKHRILNPPVVLNDPVQLTDVKNFGLSLWLLSAICVAFYVSIFPFIGLGMVFFEMKFGLSPASADSVNSIVYILSAFAAPIFGLLIDKTGKNVFWVMMGILVTMGAHGLLAFTFINPYVAMVTMGLSYSVLAAALWPQVAMVVDERQLGTAYGIMQAIQNLGLGVVSIIAGKLVDAKGYLVLEVFFLGCLCVALICTVILYLVDAAGGGKLNRSAKDRQKESELLEQQEKVNANAINADPNSEVVA